MFKGIFNRMYHGNPNRPDINPEDMPRNKFELFFTTLGVRFGDLVKINLMFLVAILPALAWTMISVASLFQNLNTVIPSGVSTPEAVSDLLYGAFFYYFLILIPLLALAGPPLAGFTFVIRNWARDEHAWIWSDFKEQTIQNWKQGAGVMLLTGALLFLSTVIIRFYDSAQQTVSWLWVMELLFVIIVGLFLLSLMYAFPMLVTYKLTFQQLLRNSVMLTLGRLPFTLLFGALTLLPLLLGVGLYLVTPYSIFVMVIYYVLIGFALASFILNSYTNATFDKLLKPADDSGEEGGRGE